MPLKKSVFRVTEHQHDLLKHRGFQYEGRVFEKTMSNFLFRDPTRAAILAKMEIVVFELIERVKMIKNHANYRVSKDYRNKN